MCNMVSRKGSHIVLFLIFAPCVLHFQVGGGGTLFSAGLDHVTLPLELLFSEFKTL